MTDPDANPEKPRPRGYYNPKRVEFVVRPDKDLLGRPGVRVTVYGDGHQLGGAFAPTETEAIRLAQRCTVGEPDRVVPCRAYLDREQLTPAETIAEFTEKYGEWKP